MSAVVLQVGQCGNQLGRELWKRVEKDKGKDHGCPFLQHDGTYRAVAVDSEPKVIGRLLKESSDKFAEKSVIHGKRGRGCNWAMGYHGARGGAEDSLLEDTMEALRQQAEKCDCFSGVVMLHSLTGGTGAGFGSRLAESIRECYPASHLLSVTVAPFISGESPLQHYNALLCSAALQRYADGVILYQNDDVMNRVRRRQKGDDVKTSVKDLNANISASLAGILLPTDSLTFKGNLSIGMEPWELIRTVTPLPATKFMHATSISKSKSTWEGLTTSLVQSVMKHDSQGNPFQALSGVAVARGDKSGLFQGSLLAVEQKLRNAYKMVSWNPFPLDFWLSRSNPLGVAKDALSLTSVVNSSSCCPLFVDTLTRARHMHSVGAYVHWYSQHGCTEGDFEEAFECVQQVVQDYEHATA